MASSDHHRSSTSATGPSISPVDSGTTCSGEIEEDEEYEYEYEEIEVEEEIDEEVEDEIEAEEEDPEEDPEEEETTMKELEEEEEDPEEDPEEEEEDEQIEEEDEEVEDDDEEEQLQLVQEETTTSAPNASIAAPNDDTSQELSPKTHDDCSKSDLSISVINLKTTAAAKSDCAVGTMTDDKCSGPLERPFRKVEMESDDKSFRKDVIMSNGCQLEVHTGGDEGFDRAKTLKRARINYQEKDCSSPSKSDCAVANMIDDKSPGPLKRPVRNDEIDSEVQSARKDLVMSDVCQLEVDAGGDKDVDLAPMLKKPHIDFQEKDCSGDFGTNCPLQVHAGGDKDVSLAKTLKKTHIGFQEKDCSGDIGTSCQLQLHAGGDKDVNLAQTLKKPHIDFQEKDCSGDIGTNCQLQVNAGGDKDVDLAQTLKRAHIDFQEKDCSGEVGAKLDKLMGVKDGHFNEKEISLESSFKGETGAEIKPVSNSKEIDEQSDMQPMDGISKAASRFCAPTTRCGSASPKTEDNSREKRPALICEYFAKGWCIKGSACRFVHKRDNTGNTSQILGEDIALQNSNGGSRELAESLSSQKCSGFITTSRDTAGGVLKQNILSDMPIVSRSSSEVHHNFSGHESGLRGFGLSFGSHSGNQLSYHTSMEGATLRPRQYMPNDYSASGLGHSMNHSHMPDWRSPFPSHSSLRQDAFRSSLVPSSGAGMERSYHASISRESRFSYGYKSKFIPYKWEPSTPFRTSLFSVPSLSTSSPECQFDPIRDSIEKPEEGTSVKASPGVGVLSHGKSYSWNPEKRRSVSDQKDMPTVEAESAAASATGAEAHTNMPKDVECGTNHSYNASRHRIEQKVEKDWQSSEMDLDTAEFIDIHRDSKALKHFRAALIEFIKGLLRPMWQEGVLTKDAFKIIVQKAEEKVVNSLQPNQIPANGEQITQYLSSSQSKIVKLLEGYAAKYRKSMSSQSLV